MKQIFLAVLMVIFAGAASGKVWYSTTNGYWHVSWVWGDTVGPAYNTTDTFVISHYIIYTSPLVFGNGGYAWIDSTGELCGNLNVYFNAGSEFIKYGDFKGDSLFFVAGGRGTCYPPGILHMAKHIRLTGPNSKLHIKGSPMHVGGTVECPVPNEGFNGMTEVEPVSEPYIFPNPNSGTFQLYIPMEDNYQFRLYDLSGKILLEQEMKRFSGPFALSAKEISAGTYIWELLSPSGRFRGKMLKSD